MWDLLKSSELISLMSEKFTTATKKQSATVKEVAAAVRNLLDIAED